MVTPFEVEFDENGAIVDYLSGDKLVSTPEERVRQRYLRVLHLEYGYPKDRMRREVTIQRGSSNLIDGAGKPVRADIVIYTTAQAARTNDQGKFFIVVECKAPTEKTGYNQLVSYIYNTSAAGGVWFNDSGADDEVVYYRRLSQPDNSLIPWVGIPRSNETWDSLGRRPKADLIRPKDIKGLLRRCHNKLHGRGTDGEESDLTMDMVRLILAKAMDEERSDPLPAFYCTPEEYGSPEGREAVADRICDLFEEVKRANSDVFSPEDRIGVGTRVIADVVVELQDYQLVSPISDAVEWDIMGHAYEQYTSVHLRRERGQFFTNRIVIDMVVEMCNPDYMDIILDPAGGSGGFLTGAMRYVRSKIVNGQGSATAKARQLDRHRTNLFMVESTKRLVRVAKTAMILNGDGHAGMTPGDSLGEYDAFERSIIARAGRGMPTCILTNPPFAGVGEGRVSHQETLNRFKTGQRWADVNGEYRPTGDLLSEGAPPELLFVERCLDWLAPGGTLGIVLPKSFLDTNTYRPGRELLFRSTRIKAVINLHKDTFQPNTGTRTCVIIAEKLPLGEEAGDYPIFMAISRRVGQNSEGVPVYKHDALNNLTSDIDEDISDILNSYRDFLKNSLVKSQYVFSINASDVDALRRINPQLFLPHLNETVKQIESIDGVSGWTAIPLDQLDPGIKIFKGPRLKSENLIVEGPGSGIEPYYTPSAMLQEKGDSAKWLNVSRADKKQIATINAIRVHKGDIVISRSGTVGRVAIITNKYDGAIVSDDLIRVRTSDEEKRAFLFTYLQSRFAQDQMSRNEYGAIQQHLEPQHIRDILIPWPDDSSRLGDIIEKANMTVRAREELDALNQELSAETASLIDTLIAAAAGNAGTE
ncbi:N-6 DNA methylase [Altererythrobacter fulvus]|uniref:N-6 DNA methylase n=1 Tax=Caenibius fulvus TaxID=2126012 RepID=UPI00301B1361